MSACLFKGGLRLAVVYSPGWHRRLTQKKGSACPPGCPMALQRSSTPRLS